MLNKKQKRKLLLELMIGRMFRVCLEGGRERLIVEERGK